MVDVLLCSTYDDQKRDFVFDFKDSGKIQRLTVPIPIPMKVTAKEFVQRLIHFHNLPCYLESELTKTLDEFHQSSYQELHDKMACTALEQMKQSSQYASDYVTSWTNAFTQEHCSYSSVSDKSEETVFSEMYKSLIHSSALETLLQLENTYALAMDDAVTKKESAIKTMEEKQQQEMEDSINNLGLVTTDKDVNDLAARHCEDAQMLETYWSSELSQLQELQKREYREWVTKVHEDVVRVTSDPSSTSDSFIIGKSRSPSVQSIPVNEFSSTEHEFRLEESFTVLLGAQKKTTHNLRLICGNVLDLCKHKTRPGGSVLSQPHRIQTALSLYSETLSGLVLLVEDRINTYSGIMKHFSQICQQSGTEFHFPDLDKQLCIIQQNFEKRERTKSTSSNQPQQQQPAADMALRPITLNTGEIYITRHSNLAEVHVVFHLVVDDSVKASNISTRNPVIVGLRNALHTAVRHSITTITIPLLLFHEMTEEMTVSWCMKRAELILKCVKGFMMECSNWSGSESLNLQFMVPKGISEEMFHSFSQVLSGIFRVSNPLDLTSAANR